MKKRVIMAIAFISVISFAAISLNARGWGDCGGCGPDGKYGPGMRGDGPGKGGYGPGFRKYDYLKQELSLSEKQLEQIFKIDQEFREKRFKVRGDYDKMITLRDEQLKAVESVLTKEQKEKFANLRCGPGYGPRGGRGGPNR